ncbi:MAG: metallopeptidase TldD-related protein, partial [Nitriliruptoraceae bacterium]
AERAEGVRQFVAADPALSAAGYLDTAATWAAFASTAGARASGQTTRATLDGIHQTPTSAGSAHQTSRRIADLDAGAIGAQAADRARRGVDPLDLDPGILEVVLGPEAVATLLVFLAVYGFNAKAHLDGASFARLDEQQFDRAIHLTEDPFDARGISLPFDAEGTPRTTLGLIEDGVTRALAHDRRTAARAGTRSTGNGVPGGEAHGAIPTNLVLRAGTTPPEQMVASIERGLLVTQFHYCRVLDPRTQVVTGLTRNGTFLIEDGQVTRAVADLRFTQPFVEALSGGNVLQIGDDDRYADAEFGPGMVICPSMHLRRWHFTGGARG